MKQFNLWLLIVLCAAHSCRGSAVEAAAAVAHVAHQEAQPRPALDWRNFSEHDWQNLSEENWAIIDQDYEKDLLKSKLICLMNYFLQHLQEEEKEMNAATQEMKPFLFTSLSFLPLSLYFIHQRDNILGTVAAIATMITAFPFVKSTYKTHSTLGTIKKNFLALIEDMDKKIVSGKSAFSPSFDLQTFLKPASISFVALLYLLAKFGFQNAQDAVLKSKSRSYNPLARQPTIDQLKQKSADTINRLVDNSSKDLTSLKTKELFYARLCHAHYLVENYASTEDIEGLTRGISRYNEQVSYNHDDNTRITERIFEKLHELSQKGQLAIHTPLALKQFLAPAIQLKLLDIMQDPRFGFLNSEGVQKYLLEKNKLLARDIDYR